MSTRFLSLIYRFLIKQMKFLYETQTLGLRKLKLKAYTLFFMKSHFIRNLHVEGPENLKNLSY